MMRLLLLCACLGSCAGSPQPTVTKDPAVRAAELAVKIANDRATEQEVREYEAFLRTGR